MGAYDDLIPEEKRRQPSQAQAPASPYADLIPAEKESAPVSLGGLAKQGLVGLAKGVTAIPGIFGDAERLIGQGTQMGINLVTGRDDPFKEEYLPSGGNLPGQAAIQGAIERNVTGEWRKPQNVAEEYAQTVGEFVPSAAFPVRGAVRGGGVLTDALTSQAARRTANVVAPAVVSESAGQATKGTPLEPWARAAGGILTPFAASAAGHVRTPFQTRDPVREASVATLRAHGIEPSAGELVGSRSLRWGEVAASDQPFAGGRANAALTGQRENLGTAALRSTGGRGDLPPTAANIDEAFTRIGDRFNTIGARNQGYGDARFQNDVADTWNNYFRTLEARPAPIINEYGQLLQRWAHSRVPMPGDLYNRLASELAREARRANNPYLRDAFYGYRRALDDMFDRSMVRDTSPDVGAFRDARRQYRNLLQVENAMLRGGGELATGGMTPAALAAGVKSTEGGRNYARGRGELTDLSQAASHIQKNMPQSGTAPRAVMQAGPAAIGAVLGGAGFAGLGPLAAGIATPALLGRALMSERGQRYLKNEALVGPQSRTTKAQRALINTLLGTKDTEEEREKKRLRITVRPGDR